ncbi:MAG: cytochrome c [Deltaproteobacteria bacterium]|nr:cytochrome c [Deltaproteobacteria bacterium]
MANALPIVAAPSRIPCLGFSSRAFGLLGAFGASFFALGFLAGCPAETKKPDSSPATSATAAHQAGQPATAEAAPAAAGAPSEADTKAALEVFAGRCVACHGAQGGGDGPASAALNPKPASFKSAEWQASVTDQHIEDIIRVGGAAMGKSPLMPPNPDLVDKPGVVAALRAHVRSLKQ